MIKISSNGVDWDVLEVNNFPANEQFLKYKIIAGNKYSISWFYQDDGELFTLYALAKHIVNNKGTLGILNIPYLPHARMDRVEDNKTFFTLKYLAEIINICKFKSIKVFDVHSNVALTHIHNLIVIPPINIVNNIIENILKLDKNTDFLYFPDKGAVEKYSGLFDFPYISGEKVREWGTGNIKGLSIPDAHKIIPGVSKILMVDDICSKGGTFYYAYKELEKYDPLDVNLYVSHLETTVWQGEAIKLMNIFTTDTIYPVDAFGYHPNIMVYEIFNKRGI